MSKHGSQYDILKLSHNGSEKLKAFYAAHTEFSYETINLAIIDFLENAQCGDVNSQPQLLTESLSALKKDILIDFERILHNPDTSVHSLLEKTHNSLIEKTALLFNSTMPKYNNQLSSHVSDEIDTFSKTLHNDYAKIQGAIDNNNMKEFVQNFDLKLSMLMQNLQQPVYSTLNNLEDKLTSKISNMTASIADNQIKMQDKLLSVITDSMHEDTSTHSCISPTSTPLKVILTPLFPSSEISVDKFDPSISHLKRIHKQNIILKSIDSEDNISVDELTNFLTMLDDHASSGILISNKSGISTKKNYEIEIHNNKTVVFLHNVDYNGSIVASAIDAIDSLSDKLSHYVDVKNDTLTISKDVMDSINNEYHTFMTQKNALVELLKEHQKRVVSQIDELRFPSLDKYLSSKYLVPIAKPGLKCDLCKLYSANNLKALAAHKRGCARKQQHK